MVRMIDDMLTEYCLLQYTITAAVFLNLAAAASDESGEVMITEDLFNTPINISDVAKTGKRLWPNRTAIPYYIDTVFDQSERYTILKALRIMEKKTKGCIQFKERTDEADYIYFSNSGEGWCYRPVSPTYYPYYIYLGKPSEYFSMSCFGLNFIQYEMMFALGFGAEQTRSDRDKYVDVRAGNIEASTYDVHLSVDPNMYTFGTKYDYHSIQQLHAFQTSSVIELPSIVPKQGLIVRMGQSMSLSPADVAKIMIAYKCPLSVLPGMNEVTDEESFPNFSLEPMTDEECSTQFNRYCSSDVTTITNCTLRRDYRIVCQQNASVSMLDRMATDMAELPMRPVSIDVGEQILAKYFFKPVQRQVVTLQTGSCITNRVTFRLRELNFTNLLHFELYNCSNLAINKSDFSTSVRLRIILFYNSTIMTMQPGTFTDLPHLEILSLEALPEDQRYYNFEPTFRHFLKKLHCACEFAWYRSWWATNKNLRLRVEKGEIYSFGGPYNFTYLENDELKKEDLYYPVDCHADPFPFGVEWLNYYTQSAYSINEHICGQADSTIGNAATLTATTEATIAKAHPNSSGKLNNAF